MVLLGCILTLLLSNDSGRIHLNKIFELCLTVFCLYFIILYNTTAMFHLKVIDKVVSRFAIQSLPHVMCNREVMS